MYIMIKFDIRWILIIIIVILSAVDLRLFLFLNKVDTCKNTCNNYCQGDTVYIGTCNYGECGYSYANCSTGCYLGECVSSVLLSQIRIQTAESYGSYTNVSIRNIGTARIDIGTLSVYIDGVLSPYFPNAGYLLSGQLTTLKITNVTPACPNKILKINLQNGLEENIVIKCT